MLHTLATIALGWLALIAIVVLWVHCANRARVIDDAKARQHVGDDVGEGAGLIHVGCIAAERVR
jgi:hypothetical protein